jgi:hypothetical protein
VTDKFEACSLALLFPCQHLTNVRKLWFGREAREKCIIEPLLRQREVFNSETVEWKCEVTRLK